MTKTIGGTDIKINNKSSVKLYFTIGFGYVLRNCSWLTCAIYESRKISFTSFDEHLEHKRHSCKKLRRLIPIYWYQNQVHASFGYENAGEGVVHENTVVIDKGIVMLKNRTCRKSLVLQISL